MLKENELIGAIAIYRQEVRPFTDKQIELVTELRRPGRHRHREHAAAQRAARDPLQQQTATADVLKVISRSTFDLQPVLDTLVEVGGAAVRGRITAGIRRAKATVYRGRCTLRPHGRALQAVARCVTDRCRTAASVVGRVDTGRHSRPYSRCRSPIRSTPDLTRQKLGGFRTVLGVPLLREGEPIGVIDLQRKQVRPFTDKQIELVETFADQAVIAIENVRLFDEVQARTASCANRCSSRPPPPTCSRSSAARPSICRPVLDTLVESAARLCDADTGAITSPEGRRVPICARAYGLLARVHRLRSTRRPIEPDAGRRSVGRCSKRKPSILPMCSRPGLHLCRGAASWAAIAPCSACRCCAKEVRSACSCLTRSEVRPFTDKQIELVTTFADQAVIAIENVRLFDEIQDKSRQLAEASQHKSQFLASMSHELRTPLNAIIGLTEMMVTNAARFGTEKAQEPLQRVNRAGTHLLGLINQVLDLSKIEAGKLELNPQTVQLAPLIEEVIGTARQLAEQNKNRLIVEAPDNLGAADRRPHAAAANPAQSVEQCLQVHQAGRGRAAGAKGGRRTRLDRVRRVRYRHRHDAGAAGEAVRGIQPGRCHDRAALRRHRAGPCHHPQARAHDGRRRDGGERAGQRLGVYSAPAGRRAILTSRRVKLFRVRNDTPNGGESETSNSIGLTSNSSQPVAMAFSRFALQRDYADMPMIGMSRVWGSFLRVRSGFPAESRTGISKVHQNYVTRALGRGQPATLVTVSHPRGTSKSRNPLKARLEHIEVVVHRVRRYQPSFFNGRPCTSYTRSPRRRGRAAWRHDEAEHPGGLGVDDQLELGRLHDRHVRGLAPLRMRPV